VGDTVGGLGSGSELEPEELDAGLECDVGQTHQKVIIWFCHNPTSLEGQSPLIPVIPILSEGTDYWELRSYTWRREQGKAITTATFKGCMPGRQE